MGTLTWTGPSGTPARRWSPIRLLGLPLSSSSAGFATERMASLSWSVQWHVSSWRTIITTLSKIHPRPGTPLRCLSEHWRTPYPQCSLRHLKGVPGLGWILDRVVIIVRQLLTCHWTDHERDAILSVAKPAEEEYKGEPSNLIGDHLLAGVPEGPVHVSVPVLLVLHPVLLKGLSKVTSFSWFIPRVEWIPEVYHCRFHRRLRIVSCHYIHLINGVVLLVVLREHAILLGSSKPLLLSVGIGSWFP